MKPRILSIIIPVYNEEATVAKVVKRALTSDTLGLKKEIIVINDGSTDRTKKFLDRLGIRYIDLPKNQGKGVALKKGFLASTGDIVLIQDADWEYDPINYPALIEPFLVSGADAVYGSRFSGPQPHRILYFWHYVANRLLTTFSNLTTNLNLSDIETGYKAFRGDLIRKIAPVLEAKRFGFEPEITAKLSKITGIRIYEVGISYHGRTYEEGKKITWRDGILAVWEIIKYSIFTKH